jgi:hypothetical protein
VWIALELDEQDNPFGASVYASLQEMEAAIEALGLNLTTEVSLEPEL